MICEICDFKNSEYFKFWTKQLKFKVNVNLKVEMKSFYEKT